MDISLLQSSVYELPTSRRVGVLVHDGATDLRLWPAPGPDRDLLHAYGPDLPRVLEQERTRSGQPAEVGTLVRLIPGRLHCDFFLWAASRAPEQNGFQADAPNAATIERIVESALEYVSSRHVLRIAFPALGAGPNAVDDAERLALIARTCARFYESRVASGQPNVLEEVLICDPRLSVVASARRLAGNAAKAPPLDKRPAAAAPAAPARERAPRASGKKATSQPRKPRLDENSLAQARATARPWDRAIRYSSGSWFVHAKFGVGCVQEVTVDGFINVLFEDGELRKLIHARPA